MFPTVLVVFRYQAILKNNAKKTIYISTRSKIKPDNPSLRVEWGFGFSNPEKIGFFSHQKNKYSNFENGNHGSDINNLATKKENELSKVYTKTNSPSYFYKKIDWHLI